MRQRRMITGLASGCLIVGGLAIQGCSKATMYRMDPSPRVDTRAQTDEEIKNALTIVNDTNFRYFWNDFGRLWLMDRRSQLSPGPSF